MYTETGSIKGLQDVEHMGITTKSIDACNLHMTGESIDRIFIKGKLVDEIHSHNLIVNSFLNLAMCLLKQQNGYTGLQYWAVGSGASSWDSTPVTPDIKATRLTSEIGRVALTPDCFSFLNSNYEVVSTPSNILQVKRTFKENECNGVWREFGIFGGNATSASNSGIMINKRHHGVITKTNEMTVERIMRFVLNLV